MGMGFPRDGWRWAWTGFITGTAGRGNGAGLERGGRGGVQKVEVKALFATRFWSTTQAMAYHAPGLASEGLPEAMVATEFWI